MRTVSKIAAIAGLALVAGIASYFANGYQQYVIAMVAVTAIVGVGLNVLLGLAGQLSLGHVGFYAIGAYSYALLSTTFGLSFWVCLPLAGILAAFWGVLLGFPVLRLRGVALPPAAFTHTWPSLSSELFLTLDLADLTLRYAR